MTSRLDDQIRDLMQQVVDESPAPPPTPLGPSVHPQPVRQRKGWATAMVTAAAILLVVLGAVWLFNSAGGEVVDDPADTPVPPVTAATTTPETSVTPTSTVPQAIGPTDAFSWGEDISRWLTTEEMAAVFEDLAWRYAGAKISGATRFSRVNTTDPMPVNPESAAEERDSPTNWAWTVGPIDGPQSWELWVHDGEHIADSLTFSGAYLTLPEGEIVTGGWGIYTIRGPNSDESICVLLSVPSNLFDIQHDEFDQTHKEMILDLAPILLRELGWTD